jgi:hypothetical protein
VNHRVRVKLPFILKMPVFLEHVEPASTVSRSYTKGWSKIFFGDF